MARAAAVLSVLAVLVLGAGVVGDESGVLLALVGAALCAWGCARGPRPAASDGVAVVVPGRRARPAADTARQHHPDSAGRPRPRAPGRARPAL